MPDPRKLRALLQVYPSLAGLPIGVLDGRTLTLAEAVELLEAGDTRVAAMLRAKGFDPAPEEEKQLAIEFYRRALQDSRLQIYLLSMLPRPLSLTEIIYHIQAGDEIGRQLLQAYRRLVRLAASLSGVKA